MKNISNRKKKKINAEIHNTALDISNNILPVGTCSCNKTLFMYLKSKEENITKYYCENKECEPGDIKNPKDKDTFFFPLQEIAKVLVNNYGEESRKIFE